MDSEYFFIRRFHFWLSLSGPWWCRYLNECQSIWTLKSVPKETVAWDLLGPRFFRGPCPHLALTKMRKQFPFFPTIQEMFLSLLSYMRRNISAHWIHTFNWVLKMLKISLHWIRAWKLVPRMDSMRRNLIYVQNTPSMYMTGPIVICRVADPVIKGTQAWDFWCLVFCMNLYYLGPCAIPQNIFEKYLVFAEIFANIFLTSM